MPLSDWLNPWRSPYDSQVPDEVSRPARSNAYFSLAAALGSSPDIIGNLSRGMMQGQQAYQGGISGYLEQQAAEEERKRKESYLELQQKQMEQSMLEQQQAAERRRQDEIERQNSAQQAAERRARMEKLVQEKGVDPRVLDLPEDVAEKVLSESFLTPKPAEIERVTMADGRLGYVDPQNPTRIIPFGGDNPIRPHYGSGNGGGGDDEPKYAIRGDELVWINPATRSVETGYTFSGVGADPDSINQQRNNLQRQIAEDARDTWLESVPIAQRRKLTEKQIRDKYWEFFNDAGRQLSAPPSSAPPGASGGAQPPPPAPGQSQSPVLNNYRNRTRFRGSSAPIGAGARVGAGGANVAGIQVPARPSAIPTGQGGARVATAAQPSRAPQLDPGLVNDTKHTLSTEGEVATRALLRANGYSDADINRYIAAAKGGGR
jgi:hypothetical protein